jgi:hypothetical protein
MNTNDPLGMKKNLFSFVSVTWSCHWSLRCWLAQQSFVQQHTNAFWCLASRDTIESETDLRPKPFDCPCLAMVAHPTERRKWPKCDMLSCSSYCTSGRRNENSLVEVCFRPKKKDCLDTLCPRWHGSRR